MRRIIITAIAITIIFISGCEDKTVNNYYEGMPGGIAGYTSPADSGTVTAIGINNYQGIIGENGYFQILDMEPGIYEVTIYPENYSRYVFHDVFVSQGDVTLLKGINLSVYPYPIRSTYPEDGAEDIHPNSRIAISTYESLDVDDLNGGTTIIPQLEGSWELYRSIEYRYVASEEVQFNTTYHITIDGSVSTEEGVPLGENMQFSFTTGPLKVSVSLPNETVQGGIPIIGFSPRVSFTHDVYVDQVNAAINFEPPINGFWLSFREDYYTTFFFFPTCGALSPNSSYMMIISDQVNLYGDVSLSEPDTTFITTAGYGVNYISPSNGYTGASAYTNIRLLFSLPMDTASVEAAFSLCEFDEDGVELILPPVEGVFTWYGPTEMRFQPLEYLNSGSVYKIGVTTDARTETGIPIDEEFESYFLVQ
jgi:hypothetical protein